MAIGTAMAMDGFLFAMQAAGLVVSKRQMKMKQEYINMGKDLQQAQYEANLEAIRLQSSEASLNEMVDLRKNIGTQIANNAAKGNRGGSSYGAINESVHNFDEDERIRRLNLMANESELMANNVLSSLHILESETQLGQAMTKQVLNTIPIGSLLSSAAKPKKKSASAKTMANPFGQESTFNWGL